MGPNDNVALDGFLQQEYKQWEKTHAKMKDSPPPDGHDYLKHANNLLVLLEGVSELHPIAKAVVVSFKTAVMFEQDRRENDARVTAVFLAQTDVMRVLLDVNNLSSRRRHRLEADVLRSDATLGEILLEIQKEIKSCGNSIDTYYKESRFVKFWKAQDWKNRILGHIDRFNRFRVELQQTLSVQVASGVEDMVSKMDIVLSRLFTPKYDWEKNLDMKTRGPGFGDLSWMDDKSTLRNLLWDTKDPSLSILPPVEGSESGTEDMSIVMAAEMQLSKVKKELQLSLDILCERNMDMFELRLNFHAQQMEQAIVNSAHLVIQSLSGPSDRLINEDLRQLWKEMDWIFCVENKFFVSALFEFYLDRFSSIRAQHEFQYTEDQGDTETKDKRDMSMFKHLFATSVAVPKFSFLSRLGALNHPDSWTLEYIALHGHHITQAIDNDSSGFIRISEANVFTHQIPKGWSLPQWCAYSAAGWAYEARIYRRRISKIMTVLTDMQAKVLASNRSYLIIFSLINFYATYHAFTREPTGQNIPAATPELRELVKQKVLDQDNVYRRHLQTLRWTVDDESTLHLLYGEMPPEKYILQFGTLMLEQFLAVTDVCRTVTIDVKDWLRLSSAFRVMREISVKRVSELQARFENETSASENIATYYGGIWSFVRKRLDTGLIADGLTPYTGKELADYLADLPILDEFPAPTEPSPYLQHPTWEEYIKTLDESSIPSSIPKTWNPIDDTAFPNLTDRADIADFPMTGWNCDRCSRTPAQEKRYRCLNINCPDFDLCQDCHSLPESDHSALHHKFDHHVMLSTLWLMPEQEQKIALEIELVLEQLQQEINALQRSQPTKTLAVEEHGEQVTQAEGETVQSAEVNMEQTIGESTTETTETSEDLEQGLSEHNEDGIQRGKDDVEKMEMSPAIADVPPQAVSVSPEEGRSELLHETETTLEPQVNEETSIIAELVTSDARSSLNTNTPQENDSSEATKSQEEPEEQLTQDNEGKPQLESESTEAGPSPETVASPVRKQFACGRCAVSISLSSDFFRCVGHACQDYFVCGKCSLERFETEDEAAHQWWHSLFLLRKNLLVSAPSDLPSTEVDASDKFQDALPLEVVDNASNLNADTIHDRMSKLEEKLLLLDGTIHSSNSALETKLVEAMNTSNSSLEAKVERLETKLDDMMAALMGLLGGLAQNGKSFI